MEVLMLYNIKAMLRKNRIILILITIIVLLGVWLVSQTLGEKVNFLNQTDKELKVPTEDFSFQAPSDWTQNELGKADLDQLVVVKISRGDPFANFHVRALLGAETIDFAQLPKELRLSFSKKTKGFREIKVSQEKIDSRDSLRYEYEYDQETDTGSYTTHQEMVITLFENKIYYLVGQAKSGDYAKVRGDIGKIFDSFKFE